MMNIKQGLPLSLVITSYTMERLNDILELLVSVKKQSYKNMETIFVVERSEELRDKIKAFINEKNIQNIQVVFSNEKLGLSIARNLGITKAKGEIIAFADDDVVLFPNWAEEMVQAFDNDSIIGVTGSAFPLWENDSLKWLPEEFYWLISCTAWTGWSKPKIVRGAFGANMAFKREAFTDNFLFAPNTGYTNGSQHQPVSDDLEFSLRLKKKTKRNIIFSPGPQVWHRVGKQRLSFRFVAQRAHQVGCTRRIIRRYYAEEFGSFEQENQVIKGIFKTLVGIPKALVTKPVLAWKKVSITGEILVSAAVGYVIPIPSYSLTRDNTEKL